jgi:hypothetical protein
MHLTREECRLGVNRGRSAPVCIACDSRLTAPMRRACAAMDACAEAIVEYRNACLRTAKALDRADRDGDHDSPVILAVEMVMADAMQAFYTARRESWAAREALTHDENVALRTYLEETTGRGAALLPYGQLVTSSSGTWAGGAAGTATS